MNSKIAAIAAASAALALTACGNGSGRMVNSGICTDFKSPTIASGTSGVTAINDAASPVDECVRRWGYSLAGSSDTADVVADAVVAACGQAISRWNQASLSQPATGEGVSLVTGQPSNPLAEHNTFARGRAILYVVEARAGQCAPPSVINGTPAGTSPL